MVSPHQNGSQVIKFDIKVKTPKGVLWCAYIKLPEVNGEIAAGVSNNQPKEIVKVLLPGINMSIE
jgi:hypothetical protein